MARELRGSDDDLYFVQDSATGCIKVGRSTDPAARVTQLQTGCPGVLRLVLVVRGGGFMEPAIHALLGHESVRGEWYPEESSIRTLITCWPDKSRVAVRLPEAYMRLGRELFYLGAAHQPDDDTGERMWETVRYFAEKDYNMAVEHVAELVTTGSEAD